MKDEQINFKDWTGLRIKKKKKPRIILTQLRPAKMLTNNLQKQVPNYVADHSNIQAVPQCHITLSGGEMLWEAELRREAH